MLDSIKQKIIEGYCEELDKFLNRFIKSSLADKLFKLLTLGNTIYDEDRRDIKLVVTNDYVFISCSLYNGFQIEKRFKSNDDKAQLIDQLMTEFIDALIKCICKFGVNDNFEYFIEFQLLK